MIAVSPPSPPSTGKRLSLRARSTPSDTTEPRLEIVSSSSLLLVCPPVSLVSSLGTGGAVSTVGTGSGGSGAGGTDCLLEGRGDDLDWGVFRQSGCGGREMNRATHLGGEVEVLAKVLNTLGGEDVLQT
jgi:hypothetical protein